MTRPLYCRVFEVPPSFLGESMSPPVWIHPAAAKLPGVQDTLIAAQVEVHTTPAEGLVPTPGPGLLIADYDALSPADRAAHTSLPERQVTLVLFSAGACRADFPRLFGSGVLTHL